jgi:glycogen operon protein
MATLLLSTGVPMLTAGDERGRTQRGNNNAFCHDSELSWVSWTPSPDWDHLFDVTCTLLRLRREHPVLRQRYFFEGKPIGGGNRKDITWLDPAGEEMGWPGWLDSGLATLGVFLAGDQLRSVDQHGNRRRDTSYLLWLHGGDEPVDVTLPKPWADRYVEVFRTDATPSGQGHLPGEKVRLPDHTLALFEAVSTGDLPAGDLP